jgi:hypothetical protein
MRAILGALFLVILAGHAAGQENSHPAASELVSFAFNPQASYGDAASRPQLAKLLGQYCDTVLADIPRNTPREHEWVRKGIDTRDLAVVESVISSVQFSRWTLAKTFAECSSHALTLADGPSLSPLAQAKLWARLVMTFNGTNDLSISAARVGLVSTASDPYAFRYLGGVRYALTRAAMGVLDDIK